MVFFFSFCPGSEEQQGERERGGIIEALLKTTFIKAWVKWEGSKGESLSQTENWVSATDCVPGWQDR